MCNIVFISLINVSAQLVEFHRRVVAIQALVHRVQAERLKVLLERLRVLAPRGLADLVERALDRLVVAESVFSVFFSNELKISLPTPQGSFSTSVPTSETRTQFSTRWNSHKSLQLWYLHLFSEKYQASLKQARSERQYNKHPSEK